MNIYKISKNTVLMVISLVIISACGVRVPWVQVSDIWFESVEYDKDTHAIWLIDTFDHNLYKLERFDDLRDFRKIEKITLPKDWRVSYVCTSNETWIIGYVKPQHPLTPTPLMIARYDGDSKTWQMIVANSNFGWCKVLANGDVVFRGQGEILRLNPKTRQFQRIKTISDVADIIDDLDGNLWVSTTKGKIYKQKQSDWTLVDELKASSSTPRLFFDSNGNLWVLCDGKYVYKYSIPSFTRETIFEASFNVNIDSFFQDNDGMTWLAANSGLWRQMEGQFQEVDIPSNAKSIRFHFYDSEANVLFISTTKGLFALDLDELP